MSKKTIRDIAILMIVVFAVTVITYPLIFKSEPDKNELPPPETSVQDFKQ
ncbi:MAG: hypothetical protein KF681_08170 [Bdellovibrionaceae bacterium]|nr:hypothetical protein [Pseudobdellovibrionaceae bacterium]